MPLEWLSCLPPNLGTYFEVVIALSRTLPDELFLAIASQRKPRQYLIVLVEEDFPNVAFLRRLHHLAFTVDVCSHLPKENIIFLDRKIGLTLPEGKELANPFSLCCSLLWRRFGRAVAFDGVVSQVSEDSLFFSLTKDNYSTWVSLRYPTRSCPLLPGSKVNVFGFYMFLVNIVEALEVTINGE